MTTKNFAISEMAKMFYDATPPPDVFTRMERQVGLPSSVLIARMENETGASGDDVRYAYWTAVAAGYIVRVPTGVVRGRRP